MSKNTYFTRNTRGEEPTPLFVTQDGSERRRLLRRGWKKIPYKMALTIADGFSLPELVRACGSGEVVVHSGRIQCRGHAASRPRSG